MYPDFAMAGEYEVHNSIDLSNPLHPISCAKLLEVNM